MTCPRPRSRGGPARWARSGTPATGSAAGCRSSTGCCAPPAGVPVAIEVFEGNTGDPKTLATQITKLKDRFGLTRVVLVGDRGMLTSARIDDELRPAALDWITALRAPQIKALVRRRRAAAVAVRRAEPGRDHPPGLSRRAAGGLQEPVPGRRAGPQARRAAGRHRSRPGQDRRGHPARPPAAARPRQDRPAGGQGAPPPQDRQALSHRDHRRGLHATPATRTPSPPKPPSTASTCCAPACPPTPSTATMWSPLQGTRPGRAGLPRLQHRPGHPPHPPPASRPGPRARVPADAVLLHQLAHEQALRAHPVSRRRQARRSRHAPTPSPPPRSDTRWPRPPANAPPTTTPVHSFTSLLADLATICANHIQPTDDMPAFP